MESLLGQPPHSIPCNLQPSAAMESWARERRPRMGEMAQLLKALAVAVWGPEVESQQLYKELSKAEYVFKSSTCSGDGQNALGLAAWWFSERPCLGVVGWRGTKQDTQCLWPAYMTHAPYMCPHLHGTQRGGERRKEKWICETQLVSDKLAF